LDYELLQSSNPEFNKAIVRVNIFRTHRQTIQYIHPQDYNKLGQAELVVIDEAAAIPLPYVQKLLGPYLVFMASTINGYAPQHSTPSLRITLTHTHTHSYEGTGRSLSLKLIDQLRKQSGATSVTDAAVPNSSGRLLKELQMQVPIRYGFGDPIEKWLNDLLCLDASTVRKITSGCPHPSQCNLYQVNRCLARPAAVYVLCVCSSRGTDLIYFRDTLFSYHKASESFLQRMMSLYVSSHYKNSPNDLLLMSDAPAHSLYVLLGTHTSKHLKNVIITVGRITHIPLHNRPCR
jgi:N-acetyltransferase 10